MRPWHGGILKDKDPGVGGALYGGPGSRVWDDVMCFPETAFTADFQGALE